MKDRSKGSQYKFSQVFGFKGINQKVHEEDIVSTLKFDQTGNHVSLGDKAGRVIIFKSSDSKRGRDDRYEYYTEFQAYNHEFDPLNSIDVDEEVLDISWMKPQGNYLKLMTMNCKNIKMWKIYEKPEKKLVKSAGKELTIPKLQTVDNFVNASLQYDFNYLRKTFPNKHEEDLIAISHSSNQQYLLSSDTLQTILWNSEKSSSYYLIADLKKGKKAEQVKENINCVEIHPTSDSMFAYGTNRGSLFLSDMRISNSYNPLSFKVETQDKKNFFTQMISSYNSLVFLNASKYIACRDFLTVKVWDVAKTNKPIASICIQDSLKSKLSEIFQNEYIFDKFNIAASKDSNTLMTGNYNSSFHTIDVNDNQNTQYEISYKKQTITKPITPGKLTQLGKMDYFRKTTACDFHPKKNMLAVALLNCFFTYSM